MLSSTILHAGSIVLCLQSLQLSQSNVVYDTLGPQLAGQPDGRQSNFVRHKGNYVRSLTCSLHFCASWPKFCG